MQGEYSFGTDTWDSQSTSSFFIRDVMDAQYWLHCFNEILTVVYTFIIIHVCGDLVLSRSFVEMAKIKYLNTAMLSRSREHD